MVTEHIRELAELRPQSGKVLSLYLDLDPSRFATADARASAVTSLVDEAHGLVEASDASREEGKAMREDLERAHDFLTTEDYADDARAIALFCCAPAGLFRVERLGHQVETGAYVDDRPHVEPLVEGADDADWGVLLVDRRYARLLRGSQEGLHELGKLTGDSHGSHTHGTVSEELKEHLDRTAEGMRVALRRRPFTALLLGGNRELLGLAEERLPGELRGLVAGRIELDVQSTGPDSVLETARAAMEEHETRRLETELDRLRTGSAHGTGALGLEDVLAALTEQRVEILLMEERFAAAGVECPQCGWLGTEGREECPADGSPLERRDDVVEPAVRRAVEQSAAVMRVRDRDDLRPFGGIAAVLRF